MHHYHFRRNALDAKLGLKSGLEKRELLAAIREHALGEAELIGTYQR